MGLLAYFYANSTEDDEQAIKWLLLLAYCVAVISVAAVIYGTLVCCYGCRMVRIRRKNGKA